MARNNTRKSTTSEYVRIRKYVHSLIQRSSGEQQLPSLSQLCQRFGVSRPTAVKALRALVQEGVLVSKPGLGTFTNLRCEYFSPFALSAPSVGLLFGDGMITYYDQYNGSMLAAMVQQLVNIPVNLHLLNLSSRSPEQMVTDICNEEIQTLVVHWQNGGEEFFRLLAEKGISVVGSEILSEMPGVVCNSRIDYEGLGYEAALKCFEEGRRNIAYIPGGMEAWERSLVGIRRACLDNGFAYDEKLNFKGNDCMERLERQIKAGKVPEAIFTTCRVEGVVRQLLQKYGVDTVQQCRLIQESPSDDGSICYCCDFQRHAKNVAESLKQLLEGGMPQNRLTKLDFLAF